MTSDSNFGGLLFSRSRSTRLLQTPQVPTALDSLRQEQRTIDNETLGIELVGRLCDRRLVFDGTKAVGADVHDVR